eukprot:g44185.t1
MNPSSFFAPAFLASGFLLRRVLKQDHPTCVASNQAAANQHQDHPACVASNQAANQHVPPCFLVTVTHRGKKAQPRNLRKLERFNDINNQECLALRKSSDKDINY